MPPPRRRGAFYQRQTKGERLARARLGFPADVMASEGVRDSQGLNWERLGDSNLRQYGREIARDAECFERWRVAVVEGGKIHLNRGGLCARALRKNGHGDNNPFFEADGMGSQNCWRP